MTSGGRPSSLRCRARAPRSARWGYNSSPRSNPWRCPIPAPDLTARRDEAQGQLLKLGIKPDGADEAFLYETRVAFPINNSTEAEELEKLIPGAKEIYVRATEQDDWKTNVTVVPTLQGVFIELANASGGKVAIKGAAEIKSVQLRASKRAVTLTLIVIHGGQTEGVAAGLIKTLGKAVTFAYESAQQDLFEKGAKATPLPERGDIVHALEEGTPVWGRVVEVNEGDTKEDPTTVLLDDFGAEHMVASADIRSFWKLGKDEGTEKAVTSYKGKCKRRNVPASWRTITVAVGEAFGKGTIPTEGAHALTKEMVDRAVELAAEAVATRDASAPAEPKITTVGNPEVGLA